MCLLMSIHGPNAMAKIREFLGTDHVEIDLPTYYVASGFDHPRWPLIVGPGASASLTLASWGLIPAWVRSAEEASKIKKETLNARAETITTKPAFRDAARSGRCLILLDGFFEYHKREGKSYPFYIHQRDGATFLVAGLLAPARGREAGVPTFSLITTEANALMAQIHNVKKRMPAILSDDQARKWLDLSIPPEELGHELQSKEIPGLEAYPVSRLVGSHNQERNLPSIYDRVVYPELGELGGVRRQARAGELPFG